MSYTTTIYTTQDAPAISSHYDYGDIDHTNGFGDFLYDLVSLDGEYIEDFNNGDMSEKDFLDIKKSCEFFLEHMEEHLTLRI